MTKHGCAALILAAGRSSRMSPGLKPLLPLSSQETVLTALAMLAKTYRQAGVDNIFVVSGHEAVKVEQEAKKLGLGHVHNPGFASGMFSSVCTGISMLQCTHAFIQPADIPLVRALTITTLMDQIAKIQRKVLIPAFKQETGHPPLVPACHFEAICSWAGTNGLQGALANLPIAFIPVPDSLILYDMDIADDYAQICRTAALRHLLSPSEARELLRIMDIPPRGLDHAKAVSLVARSFAEVLNNTGKYSLNVEVAEAGGLLHDICKGQHQHEKAAGELLRSLYLPDMANLVEDHRDCHLPDNLRFTEREVIYLADKYMQRDRSVSLAQRFGQKIQRNAGNPVAVKAIEGRLQRAREAEKLFVTQTGKQPLDIARTVAQG